MSELVSRAVIALRAVCITLRGLAGDMRQCVPLWRALTSSQPRGLEWMLFDQSARGWLQFACR
jgi:hypothetical protein